MFKIITSIMIQDSLSSNVPSIITLITMILLITIIKEKEKSLISSYRKHKMRKNPHERKIERKILTHGT